MPCSRVKRNSYQGLDWESALQTQHIGTVWGRVQSHSSQSHSRPPASLIFPISMFALSHWPFHAPISGNVLFHYLTVIVPMEPEVLGESDPGSSRNTLQRGSYAHTALLCVSRWYRPLLSAADWCITPPRGTDARGLTDPRATALPQRKHSPVQGIPEPQVLLRRLQNYHLLNWNLKTVCTT